MIVKFLMILKRKLQMHYNINDNEEVIIKSEYAAKSIRQQSRWLINWLNELPKDSVCLDYGCGKLRYTIPLLKRVKEVTAVDSLEQMNRIQKIDRERHLTIKEFAKDVNNLRVITTQEFNYTNYFDWTICTNVLSAIPYENERIKVLKTINNSINKHGKALITTQYRNSYYKNYENRDDVQKFQDGWLISNKNRNSFYGIIPPMTLKQLCLKAEMKISEFGSIGESAYVIIEKS